jgi:shikimate dehydrogenase
MRKFGLIGYPLGHSFSKQYFSDKFSREKIIDCSYENYPISDINQLKNIIKSEPELCGLNVTIPYKTKVIHFLDFIAEEAYEIGAVNVIKIERKKNKFELYGYNSDYVGVTNSLKQYFDSEIKQALILGTGGASKAVWYALKKAGVTVQFASREKKAGALTYSELTPEILATTQLIVNTTPLGMFPNVETLPNIDYKCLDNKHILFDLVYNPEITAFLQKGTERDCKIITGSKMLVSQAERAWQIWNDELL